MSKPKPSILVIEDEPKLRRLLELQLADEGFRSRTAESAETGLQLASTEPFDLVLSDYKLPGMTGVEFLQALKRVNANLPVVIMTAYGTVEAAVDAMKAGASDYILKPFSLAELVLVIRKELVARELRDENRALREALGKRYEYKNVVAQSDKMQAVLALVERVAATNAAWEKT
jgi:DNA-binding NtrC family response regulator